MAWGATAAHLDGGERLHLQHGPIDLIVGCDADRPGNRAGDRSGNRPAAFEAAARGFDGVLERLVDELGYLRSPLVPGSPAPVGPVAGRMVRAARPFCADRFLTPMIAVAGSVADAVLAAMVSAVPLRRAYVNNGGDIALHLAGNAEFSVALAGHDGAGLGRIVLRAGMGVGGIATSGRHGRSHSMGIADSVSVLARDAATADVAATLIANAVDLPGHSAIRRRPAGELSPDSDLGDRPVVVSVAALSSDEVARALARGAAEAEGMLADDRIVGAALFLRGRAVTVGTVARIIATASEEPHHA